MGDSEKLFAGTIYGGESAVEREEKRSRLTKTRKQKLKELIDCTDLLVDEEENDETKETNLSDNKD